MADGTKMNKAMYLRVLRKMYKFYLGENMNYTRAIPVSKPPQKRGRKPAAAFTTLPGSSQSAEPTPSPTPALQESLSTSTPSESPEINLPLPSFLELEEASYEQDIGAMLSLEPPSTPGRGTPVYQPPADSPADQSLNTPDFSHLEEREVTTSPPAARRVRELLRGDEGAKRKLPVSDTPKHMKRLRLGNTPQKNPVEAIR